MALPSFAAAASRLTDIGRRFYLRGWMHGTSGNLSAVVSHDPVRLAITASSVAKGAMTARDILKVDDRGKKIGARPGRPSAETLLHLEVVRARGAGAVLHTHSVWSTILSDVHARSGGVAISGFEMAKGLDGVRTHEHREFIPILILENDQDMARLALEVRRLLATYPDAHGFLLRRHGLYTWGATIDEAERHVEAVEFLFESIARRGEIGL